MQRAILSLVLLLAASHAAAQDHPAAAITAELDSLGRQGGRDAVRQIEARIEQGLPPRVLARAVAALARIGDRGAVSVLLELASHRRAAVRAQVAEALGHSSDSRGRSVLADLLDDPDPRVRSAAAVGIGLVGAQGVIDTVIQAAARGVAEAAIALGQHARPGDIPRVLRRLDASTLGALAPALRVLLDREDLPLRSKRSIVAALAQLNDPECEHILREVGAALAPNDPLRPAVDEALTQLTATEEGGAQ